MNYRPVVVTPDAAEIDWDYAHNFSPDEFSEDAEKYAHPILIHRLQDLRTELNQKIYVSPVPGALARFSGSKRSQHHVGPKQDPDRKSTAVDIFPEGVPLDCITACCGLVGINGIGVYLGTKGVDGLPWVMIHIDTRSFTTDIEKPLIWISDESNTYYYPQRKGKYWKLFMCEILFKHKVKGKR